MGGAIRSVAVAESKKIFLIDALKHGANRVLNDFVLQRCNPQRSRATIRLRNVYPARRFRSLGSTVNPTMKIDDASLQVFLVFVPSHLINADGCLLLELVKARSQQFDIDVVKQGSELEVTALTSRLTHTMQSA